ncbi:hypothetical protein HN51_061690 [Arachis hypogaea]|uniref:E3 ubiquitin-protein ligase SIRP1 n=1 Tax=Arachis hypogaea TaxID=3818 RepID=UPI0007AEF096|nr:probable E3 ubiquitin-protein ligase RHC1A [Arachis ipaensis]XP_025626983.1 E3 ubiquitin-protein ligase SIRP1 [Arachis hypogaea]XP_025626984.1 E3 ubiquitin-protein ligase SIRP1 [Arachis hypogaea]QHO19008.1 RING finger protein [Arachis hypogaea]QHO19009.1 RING finger protein [Arachis hypogaea]QHO19010.1 RING finger protein [Arachis hypogaea]QHO19011.1 RING finger protein [Arachis hypogaea]
MEEAMAARYWCHMCSQMVNPITEGEIKCPLCQSGFVEEMSNTTTVSNMLEAPDFGPDRTLSLWAPILLGMLSNPHNRRRPRRLELDDDDNDNHDDHNGSGNNGNATNNGNGNSNDNGNGNGNAFARLGGENEYDRELESILRRRRRSSATILQLLQGIRAGLASELNENTDGDGNGRERERERDRERVILINPFNQTIIVQGSYDWNRGQGDNHTPIGSLGDYFIGPGLDLLLQHLAENDPNRHGTPPAQKEAIEALPTVTIDENMQCSICLDDLEVGSEAKQMPCKHMFHSGCILPWLELHSSCPVCRYQLPADESKREPDASLRTSSNQREDENTGHDNVDGDIEGRNASGSRRFSFPWPFNGLFSSPNPSAASSSSNNPNGDNVTRSEEN